MIFKGCEVFNAAELFQNEDGSTSWCRVPVAVSDIMEKSKKIAYCATGVELRFVMKSDTVKLVLSAKEPENVESAVFHVYRGGLQGGWEDHEVDTFIHNEPHEHVIHRSKNMKNLHTMTEMIGLDWSEEVVRVIFDRGDICIHDIIGDVVPPTKEQCPSKMILFYGSSITHGSNSIDISHTWASQVGYRLNMDVRNLGMAGSCCMEPALADYIATEGEQGKWDVAVLELGINVLDWEEPKIYERVENILRQVAGRNAGKPVVVISPFYYGAEALRGSKAGEKWRRVIPEVIEKLNYSNVHYLKGTDILGDISGMSADEIHPSIYGIQQIADRLTAALQNILK